VQLRRPTDFLILEALDEYGRNVATNLKHHTDKSRKNINTRLPVLEDYGLVRKIGPAEHSGLYEITQKGQVALRYRDQYGEVDDFETLLDQTEGPNAGEAAPAQQAQTVARSEDPEVEANNE
jgi:DNA-binding HxlR family transcriptional regulator